MAHGHHIEIVQEQFQIPAKAKTFAIVVIVLGLILAAAGLATMDKSSAGGHHEATKTEATHENKAEGGHEATAEASVAGHEGHEAAEEGNVMTEKYGPRMELKSQNKPWTLRIWTSVMMAAYYLLLISLAALFFIAVQYIANAGWSAAIKRVPEAISTFIPVPFILVLLVILVAKNDIYHWVHYEHLHLSKGQPGFDRALDGKSWFLNSKMLLLFPTALVIIWVLIGMKLRKLSVQEDSAEKGNTFFFKKSIRWSAGFAVLYGFTLSVVAWLFIMSIDAHWYSTIFGVYNFATGWVSALTVICLFVVYLKQKGYLKIVTDEHVHDLGKFMFAFSIFWAYIWISQYLLIWYAHIPEEMAYYQIRYENYKPYFLVNLVLNFFTPFLFLMMRNAKRSPKLLYLIGALMLIGHYNDIWLMVTPGIYGTGMNIGMLEIGTMVFLAGVFVYWVLTALTKRGLIAVNHPYIEESAHHDVGV